MRALLTYLRAKLPSREQLRNNRFLRWLGPGLFCPGLWCFRRRTVALGVAIGVFFGMLVPVGQSPLAAACALLLRANLPVAITSTLVSNPLTYAPIYYLAHQLGITLAPGLEQVSLPAIGGLGWLDSVLALGLPLLLGLAVFAVVLSPLSYLLTLQLWVWQTRWRRRHRHLRHAAG
ncbi:DUF2062 domain-containing protein [Chitinilyticum litopenaei]|uniref:DUF2062 domain-containing protein n=1 Tax=Chitinilyticum litopenaei TaxID=1121276 RepID=UPI0004067021|nr:DUF2062 domain-containing protein [Chitinilyticum litopenaei]